jgi:hypothetical protein
MIQGTKPAEGESLARGKRHPNLPRCACADLNASAFSAAGSSSVRMDVYKKLAFSVSTIDNFLNNPQVGYNKNSFQFSTVCAEPALIHAALWMVRECKATLGYDQNPRGYTTVLG